MIRSTAAAVAIVVLLAGPPATVDPVRDAQWHLAYLNVAEAHKTSQGAGVTVALLDTGVDAGHPDLSGNVMAGTDFSIDGPGDGLVDTDGHGTSMAGLIAADGRTLGIAPQAKVRSVRITTSGFGGSSLSTAIDWAVDHGAQVICIAAGVNAAPALQDAVTRALRAEVVIVAAAGNTSVTAPDSAVDYPAAYDGVIAAAAIDRNSDHDPVSVAGPEVVLAAPGRQIASTDARSNDTGGYIVGTGTSPATAIIAGAAALVRSKYPNLSAAEVVHRLTATADDKGPPGRDNQYGYGVVNLVKALTADIPPLNPTTNASTTPNATAAATPSISGDSGGGNRTALLIGIVVIGILLAVGGYLVWRRQGYVSR